jgi:hypothetical protein
MGRPSSDDFKAFIAIYWAVPTAIAIIELPGSLQWAAYAFWKNCAASSHPSLTESAAFRGQIFCQVPQHRNY